MSFLWETACNPSDFPSRKVPTKTECSRGIQETRAIRDLILREVGEKYLAQIAVWYRGLMAATPDDGLRSVEDALTQRIGTGIEFTAPRQNGSEFPIEIMLSPLQSAKGILVTPAIRVHQRAEAAEGRLVQMGGGYRGLLEAPPDAMDVVDQAREMSCRAFRLKASSDIAAMSSCLSGEAHHSGGLCGPLLADCLRSSAD